MSKKIDELEKRTQEAFGEAFSLFEAIKNSAERWYMGIEEQRIQAIKTLNKAIEAHNQLEMARAKKAVEFAKRFDDLDRVMRESNKECTKLYEKCQGTLDILESRLEKVLEEEE